MYGQTPERKAIDSMKDEIRRLEQVQSLFLISPTVFNRKILGLKT